MRGCGLTAGTCELDHVVPVRQAFAGSVQTLQALCGDCHSEKTLRESAQPTSLESRVAPGVMEYARSPKLPPLVFEAQTCNRDALYVGVDVVRCRRNGQANAPFPLPILSVRRLAGASFLVARSSGSHLFCGTRFTARPALLFLPIGGSSVALGSDDRLSPCDKRMTTGRINQKENLPKHDLLEAGSDWLSP